MSLRLGLGALLVLFLMIQETGFSHSEKLERLFPKRNEGFRLMPMAKSFPKLISISLKSDLQPPAEPARAFNVMAVVSSEQNISNAHLFWKVPKDVKILSGALQQNLNLEAGKPVTISLTLEVPNINNHKIFAEAFFSPDGKQKAGASAQFNTNPQMLDPIHSTLVEEEVLVQNPNKPQLHKARSGKKKIIIVQ